MKPPFKYKEYEENGWEISGIFDADNEMVVGYSAGWDSSCIPSKEECKIIVESLNLYYRTVKK